MVVEIYHFVIFHAILAVSKISVRIGGVKKFSCKEMALATNNFDSSSQVGQGG